MIQRFRVFDSVVETCNRNNTSIKIYNSRKKFNDVCDILDHQFYLIKQELLNNPKVQVIKNRDYFDIKHIEGNKITYLGELKRNNFTSSYSLNVNPKLSNEKSKVMRDITSFANIIKEWDNDSVDLTAVSNKWDYNLSNPLYY